jgi:Fe-S-cluster formation regulator IscX/YfhJ
METEDGWVGLRVVGHHLANIASDFDPRTYCFQKLSDLVRKTGAFDLDQREGGRCGLEQRRSKPVCHPQHQETRQGVARPSASNAMAPPLNWYVRHHKKQSFMGSVAIFILLRQLRLEMIGIDVEVGDVRDCGQHEGRNALHLLLNL